MLDDIRSFTLETISIGILGAYASESVTEDIAHLLPVLATGVVSIPKRFTWPLNKLPMFQFGRSLDARVKLIEVIQGILKQRREDKARLSSEGVSNSSTATGILDAMLEMQGKQAEAGGPVPGQAEYDDEFIVDNVRQHPSCQTRYAREDQHRSFLAQFSVCCLASTLASRVRVILHPDKRRAAMVLPPLSFSRRVAPAETRSSAVYLLGMTPPRLR